MIEETDDSGRRAWDDEKSAALKGAIVLGGFTYLDAEGEVDRQLQFYGLVLEADPQRGISIECHGQTWHGQTIDLPPDIGAFQVAPPGVYRLRTTGETITDPAFTVSYTISAPSAQPN